MSVKYAILKCGIGALRAVYSVLKLGRMKNRITIISRQSDNPSVDIELLRGYLEKNHPEIECVVMTKLIRGGIGGGISYGAHILRQMKAIAGSRVVIVDGYCIAVSVLKHRPETRVIQMWHAMAAIKKFGYQTLGKSAGHSRKLAETMCMHRNYDYVICPGEATGEFLCRGFNCTADKLRMYALPRVDYILDSSDENTKRLKEYVARMAGGRTVLLYAPTFRKNNRVKLRELFGAVDFSRYFMIVSPHPLDADNYREAAAELQSSDNLIIDSREGSFGWLKVCDRLISDYSAIAVEALVTGKPIYFYVYDIEEYDADVGLNINPIEVLPDCASKDGRELMKIIDGRYDFDGLKRFKDKYITVSTENCTGRLAEFAAGLCSEQQESRKWER